jgi:hypothetical protein
MYTEEGVVHPEIDPGLGRGKVRRYSKGNLFEFLIIRQLSEFGITLPFVKDILHNLRISHWSYLQAIDAYPERVLTEKISEPFFGKLQQIAEAGEEIKDDFPIEKIDDMIHTLRMGEGKLLDRKATPFTDFMERYGFDWAGMRLSVYRTANNEKGFDYISEVEKLLSSKQKTKDPIVSYLVIDLELLYKEIRDL